MTFDQIRDQAISYMNEPPGQAAVIFDRALVNRMRREQATDRRHVAMAMYRELRGGTSDYWEKR